MEIKRGQIYYCNFGNGFGSEQGGVRPCIILQNDKGNKFSPTTVVAPITTRNTKAKLPTHFWLTSGNLPKNSMVLMEQIRVVDKQRLAQYIGSASENDMKVVNRAIEIELGV